MESFYRGQNPDPTFASIGDGQGHAGLISMSPVDGMDGMDAMDGGVMMRGDTLDDIIMQNNKEMERRRSVQQYRAEQTRQQSMPDAHRTSMLEFGSGSHGNLSGYQFDPSNAGQGRPSIHRNSTIIQSQVPPSDRNPDGSRRQSTGALAISTQFASIPQNYNQMAPPQAFPSPIHQELTMNPQDSYNTPGLSAGLPNQIPMEFASNGMEHVSAGGDAAQMNMYTQHQHSYSSGLESPHLSTMAPNFSNNIHDSQDDPGGGSNGRRNSTEVRTERDVMTKMPNLQMAEGMQNKSSSKPANSTNRGNSSPVVQRTHSMGTTGSNESAKQQNNSERSTTVRTERMSMPANSAAGGDTSPSANESTRLLKGKGKPQNAYSSTGFDMLSVLMKVATRPNPEINIGAVDMSCAFVVCDVRSHDLPIVYCSDIFERMTGYSRHEILGQNCRFLQSPTGKVQSGVPRKYCDDDTVLFIKRRVEQRKEAQAVIINYRKGGHGFQNLLTMIPITWDDTDEVRYFVGFQTDLVEKPNSIISKNPDGTYTTNYQRGYVPRYVWSEPDSRRQQLGESGHTIGRDDVSTVLTTIGSGESELSKRIWDKVLLENTDDVVHVLSLKGLFLYLSPSSRKVLEYDASELVGTALSSVCHPSDIVPVTRELKDTSTGAAVNVVFRIRRKHSGYTWFESHGSLHTEQGKGRKCIILVGRERPVYALSRHDMEMSGGISDSELWSKMSTSGMFLFVSSNSRSLLDRQPEELVGTSIQALMRSESKIEFGRILEQVRSGKRAHFKHEMQNKRGQTLQAQSSIYPGDAAEGQKPTFLVAQTRLLRPSRSGSTSTPKPGTPRRLENISSGSTQTPSPSLSGALSQARGISTPQTAASASGQSTGQNGYTYEPITSQAGGAGLPIGSQDVALASDLNVFDELKTTRSTSWQFELRQMEKKNRILKEELDSLQSARRKRKRKKNPGHVQKECANCHTRSSPEWRRGPSGNRDLCNSCGLRWTKQQGRTSPRSQQSGGNNSSPRNNTSPLNGESSKTTSSVKKSSPNTLKPERNDQQDLHIEQKSYSFDNSAIRPPKIEEQDEGFSSGGGGVQ